MEKYSFIQPVARLSRSFLTTLTETEHQALYLNVVGRATPRDPVTSQNSVTMIGPDGPRENQPNPERFQTD